MSEVKFFVFPLVSLLQLATLIASMEFQASCASWNSTIETPGLGGADSWRTVPRMFD